MFSYFKNHAQNIPIGILSIKDLHHQLVNPDQEPFIKTINMIQRLRQVTDEDVQKKIKGELPAFTPGGQVNNKSKEATPDQRNIRYSGFMQVDIDAKDNPNMKDAAVIRDKLALLPYIALSAVSARGRGVWGLLALAEPEKFRQYADQVRDYFKLARINIDISKSKNPSELRYFAPDPGAILKQQYKLFPLQQEQLKVRPKSLANNLSAYPVTSLADLQQWVTETTGYRLVDGQKHYFIFWLSYALRKNGTTEGDVYETIYTRILPQELIHSNCISSGIEHANAKRVFATPPIISTMHNTPTKMGTSPPLTSIETTSDNEQAWGVLGLSGRFYFHISNGRTEVYMNPGAYTNSNLPLETLSYSNWMDLKFEEYGWQIYVQKRKEAAM